MASKASPCSSSAHTVQTCPAWRPRLVAARRANPRKQRANSINANAEGVQEPLMVRAARNEKVERPPCWMMRQAGRYQKAFRDVAELYPSFRQRSETTDLIVEISLQPWNSFKPDGVILFSDILTPFPAFGVPFEIDNIKGPVLSAPIQSVSEVESLHPIDLERLSFVGTSLKLLREEVGSQAAVVGFIGAPWTLATYIIEGGSSSYYKIIKAMMYSNPKLLDTLLSFLAIQIAEYAKYQIESGAHSIQIFDSWGGQLAPKDWDRWSGPYIKQLVESVKAEYPSVPLTLYANGSGGLLERLKGTGVDVIGLDWTLDVSDARGRLGKDIPVQGNVDPVLLFAGEDAITEGVKDCIAKAGHQGHILNLGHGVMVGTPEESVAHMFALSKEIFYSGSH